MKISPTIWYKLYFYMINQYLSSELNLVGDFHDAKHFCEDHFFILVYLLNWSICLVSHTNYLAILLLFCMKPLKLEDINNHWKLTINLRVGSKWPITGYIIDNLALSFFILCIVYVGLFNWENSLFIIKKNHFFSRVLLWQMEMGFSGMNYNGDHIYIPC